jgi:hypothetical protein
MKKTLLLAILCVAALAACSDNNTLPETSTEPTTEAVTTAATTNTTTTTVTSTTTVTTVTTTAADEKGEPTVIRTAKLTEDIFEEYEFNTLMYYNGRTVDELTVEEKEHPGSFPLYSTLDGELTDEHKQMLNDYFKSHEFEEVDYNDVHYLWDCGLLHDKSPEKNLIWLPMADNKEWLENGHTPHLGGNIEFILSDDRKFFAIRKGISGSFNTYKIAAPEELDFLYDLVPE